MNSLATRFKIAKQFSREISNRINSQIIKADNRPSRQYKKVSSSPYEISTLTWVLEKPMPLNTPGLKELTTKITV